jgi:glutaredoxin
MIEPVVYFKPGCPFGIRLRTALTLHRVPYRAVRFRDDEDGAAKVREVNDGNEISPTVYAGGGLWLTNPGWREVREAFIAARDSSPTCGSRLGADSMTCE